MKLLNSTFSITILFILLIITSCGIFMKSQSHSTVKQKNENSLFPKPIGYVNDFENILTKEEEKELIVIIKEHESQTSDQISVVTLISIEPYDNINDYTLELAKYWGVGQKEKNNGILIALGRGLKEIRIQNGLGIEKRLTDIETKQIIDDIMIPQFKADKYFEGLKLGIEAIIHKLK